MPEIQRLLKNEGEGMYKLLVRLMLLAALWELGVGIWELGSCTSRAYVNKVEKASRKVLDVEWKPISVFPEEGKRFGLSSR